MSARAAVISRWKPTWWAGRFARLVYDVDQQRAPLTDLAEDERLTFLENVLRINLADKTREEIMADFEAGPVTVTI